MNRSQQRVSANGTTPKATCPFATINDTTSNLTAQVKLQLLHERTTPTEVARSPAITVSPIGETRGDIIQQSEQ